MFRDIVLMKYDPSRDFTCPYFSVHGALSRSQENVSASFIFAVLLFPGSYGFFMRTGNCEIQEETKNPR